MNHKHNNTLSDVKKCCEENCNARKVHSKHENVGKYFPQFLHILARTRAATTNQIRRNVAKLFNSTVNQFEIVSGPDSPLPTPDSRFRIQVQIQIRVRVQLLTPDCRSGTAATIMTFMQNSHRMDQGSG